MSEKHLTESPWKSLATKQKFKDPALGKALAAYEKLDEDDFDARLEALDEIEKEAKALLKEKEVKGNDDLSGYLEEIEKEGPKSRRTVEAAQQEAEDEEEEEEEESKDPAAIKKKLMAMLSQVKQKGPEDQQIAFMAGLAKGHSAVVLAKTAGSTQKKLLLELMPNAQGPKFIKGECRWENNAYTFVV